MYTTPELNPDSIEYPTDEPIQESVSTAPISFEGFHNQSNQATFGTNEFEQNPLSWNPPSPSNTTIVTENITNNNIIRTISRKH